MTSTDENPVQTPDNLAVTPNDNTSETWQLNALTAALGDLTLTVTDSLSVGRGSDNDVVLGSKEVSRNHAILSVLNDKLYVKDLDSSNGTFINDQRIESNKSKYVKPEDTISFASFAFQVSKGAAAEEVIEPSEILDADDVLESSEAQASTDVLEPEVIEAVPLHDTQPLDASMPTAADTTAAPLEVVINNDDRVDILEDRPAAAASGSAGDNVESAELEDSIPDPLEEGAADTKPTGALSETIATNDYDKRIDDVFEVHPASSDSAELEDSVPDPLQEDVGSTPAIASETAMDDALTTKAPVQDQPFKDEHLVKTPKPTTPEAGALTSNAPATLVTTETAHPVQTPVIDEPLISDPVLEEPLIAEPEAAPTAADNMSQSAQLASEQDKTTTTPLQEEADPDILRAKQAATAQFSGTANLGGSRDVGTEGNNALDQAIDNPANPNAAAKKPSGGWFIWVFIAVIIIGIAIWLFNMGSM